MRNTSFSNSLPLKLMALVVILLSSIYHANSQEEEFSTQGDHFIFGFPPNFHNEGAVFQSFCSVIIIGEPGTTGEIIFYRNNTPSDNNVTDFTLDGDGTFTRRYSKNSLNVEVESLFERYRSFEIFSDAPVTVYALNNAQYTAESMIVYPVNTLGKEYYVMSYPSLIRAGSQYHPSQLMVVATEDNTTVNLFYSAAVDNTDDMEQTVTLNKNESFLVQSRFNVDGLDLTGSRVEADKAVAVFGSHNRALIRQLGTASSYDYLLEMMPPKVTWAGEFYFIPFRQPNQELNSLDSDKFRISPIFNNTEIFIDGVFYTILNSNEMIELDLEIAGKVKATAPILVAQYKKSNSQGSGASTSNSDPFMMIVPPREQYMDDYRFQVLSEGIFVENYITVIAPSQNIREIQLDGAPVLLEEVFEIPGSGYSYGFASVAPGAHRITGDVPFGLYVYGYGQASSYGYVGGTAMRRIDNNPPVFSFSSDEECFFVEGKVEETQALDTYIYRLALDADRSQNTLIDINGTQEQDFFFTDTTNTEQPYRIVLDNIYDDGFYRISAYDRKDYKATEEGPIKGFTVGTDIILEQVREPELIENIGFWDEDFIAIAKLNNYGDFPQLITELDLLNSDPSTYEIGLNLPITLQPGQMIDVPITFRAQDSLIIKDTLVAKGECHNRSLYAFDLIFVKDYEDPLTELIEGDCSSETIITISDDGPWNRGIESVNILQNVNLEVLDDQSQLPDRIVYVARIIDKTRDAVIEVEAVDGEGNTVSVIDTIPGFSIDLAGIGARKLPTGSSEMECMEFPFYNSGFFPIILSYSDIANGAFAVPPSSFPLTVMPGDTAWLPVCWDSDLLYRDTVSTDIKLGNDCSEIGDDLIVPGQYFLSEDSTDCDTELRLISSEDRTLGGPIINRIFPLPASDMINLRMVLNEGDYSITLTNLLGEESLLYQGTSPGLGIYFQSFDISQYPAGSYYLTITNGADKQTVFIVVE